MSSSWPGEEAGKGPVAHTVTSLVKAYRQGGRENVDDGKEFTVPGAEHRVRRWSEDVGGRQRVHH